MRCHQHTRNAMRPMTERGLVGAILVAAVLSTSAAPAGPVTLWNGVEGAGSLTITVGDFGSFGTWLNWPDLFDPGGDLDEMAVTFSTLLFVSIDPSETGDGTHRGVLSAHPTVLGTYPDGNLTGVVTQPNVLSDPATTASEFDIVGDGVHFSVTLLQKVTTLPNGPDGQASAMLEQVYEFTNLLGSQELIVTKNLDQDLPWGGGPPPLRMMGVDFAALDRPQIYVTTEEHFSNALVLRTETDLCEHPITTNNSQTGACNSTYYVGWTSPVPPPGNPQFPGGGCPLYDFGTDFQIWDSYGVPNCWKNFLPTVGYSVPGITIVNQGDSFIGLQTEGEIGNNETYRVNFQTLYGYFPLPAPSIVHADGLPDQTRPHSGYIDPRAEVGFPPDDPDPAGLTAANVQFNLEVFGCDGSDVDAGDFSLNQTGDGDPPVVVSAVYVDPEDHSYVRVEWDRPITPKEWTTLIANVCNAEGGFIESQGDAGPGVEEPDRVDMALLPCDVNQDGTITPFDLLGFRQMINSGDEPEAGIIEDYIDINRDGDVTPFDLLTFRQLINGVSPATQAWASAFLIHPQP